MRTWRLLGEYDSETTAFTALAGSVGSPYTPDFNGRLVALRTIVGGGSATSLVQHIIFRLTCTKFNPNAGAETPVTVEAFIYGLFEVGG